MAWLRRWAAEPLLHFLLLGAAMFGISAWTGSGTAAGHQVVVTARTIEFLGQQFATTWGRPPDAQELKHVIDDHVKQEIAGDVL